MFEALHQMFMMQSQELKELLLLYLGLGQVQVPPVITGTQNIHKTYLVLNFNWVHLLFV
jgi:hypothetical protein